MEIKKNYFIWALLPVVFIIVSYMLVSEIIDFKRTMDNISQEKSSIEDLKEVFLYLKTLEGKADELDSMLNSYKMMIPGTPQEGNIITSLTNIAENNNIEIKQIQFGDKKSGGKLIQMPVKLNLTGDYYDFITFLGDVHSNSRIMVINDITLRRADETTGELVIDISLNAFYKE